MATLDALKAVREWMHDDEPRPSDDDFVTAISVLMAEWRTYTRNGMDVLASACLDEVREIVDNLQP